MRVVGHSEPWWIIARVTGIAALVGVLAVAGFGIALARRRSNRRVRTKLRPHRLLSWLTLVMLGAHIGAALLDRRHVPPYAVVAPFASPVRTVAAGTGSLAAWGLVVVALTAAGRRWLRPSWRQIHYVAYPAMGFALVHSFLGSDRRPMLAAMLSLGALILLAIAVPRLRTSDQSGPGRRWCEDMAKAIPRWVRPGVTVAVGEACEKRPLFAIHEIQGLIEWSERHPGPGALVHGALFGLVAFVFALPLGYLNLLWASTLLGASCGLFFGAMAYHHNRRAVPRGERREADRDERGRAGWIETTSESAGPTRERWLARSRDTSGALVRCVRCSASQSAWAGVCSRCGADLASDPIDDDRGGQRGPRSVGAVRYRPKHLQQDELVDVRS